MQRFSGPRTLLTICAAFVVLMGVLAVVQYRWSQRVAAADVQREREHLDSAATLFANEFNGVIEKAVEFMQNDALAAFRAHQLLINVPPIIGELYYINLTIEGKAEAQKLTSEGRFTAALLPQWLATPRCASIAISRPPMLISPVVPIVMPERAPAPGARIRQAFGHLPSACFVARLNETYLRADLLSRLIRQSFGETSNREYDFSIVARDNSSDLLYGARVSPDVRRPFFAIAPPTRRSETENLRSASDEPAGQFRLTVVMNGETASLGLFGDGVWELDVARKGMPLAAAFERTRRRDLWFGLAVEALLIAAIVFLVTSMRRTQRLADQKMQFVAAVSHELRTPVSAISMLSKNQADGLVASPERVKQYGELMHQESRRLSDMVEKTLQYAGIHSGLRRKTNQPIDLAALLQQAVEARRDVLAHRGFEIEMAFGSDLPPVFGDANLLRTAVDNLLNNAEKYSDGTRWIRVSARYSEKHKEVLISVEDRGLGIDPADQEEIFEPFARGQAALAAQIPGSGLGLSLVRSAAEAHRGSVTLESEPGRGSIFTLHLPV